MKRAAVAGVARPGDRVSGAMLRLPMTDAPSEYRSPLATRYATPAMVAMKLVACLCMWLEAMMMFMSCGSWQSCVIVLV